MKKSRDLESSLELLLDTMCNSFGGVMFIAITLIIVLSMTSKVKEAVTENLENPDAMQKKIEELKKEFTQIQLDTKQTQHALDIIKNDPRLKFLKDVVILEQQLKKLETEKKILSLELDTQKKKNRKIADEKNKIYIKFNKQQNVQQKLVAENTRQQQELKDLNDELKKIAPEHITFKTMSPSKKIPYYLIVFNSKIWRIGPEVIHKDPHSDVKFNTFKDNDAEYIVCTIRDLSGGVPLLENGMMSSEARALLNSLPANRFPSLSVHSNSVADFCKFREELKQNNTTHSVDINFERNNNKFIYYYTAKKYDNYEAY